MEETKRKKILGIWYMIGVGMLLGQIILGGVTRLTGSGLSITEWKAILGFLPPMNEQDWNLAFIKYQQFGQYKLVNTMMTLSQFKWIFFWEWFHRLWARLIGFAALIPLVYFIYKKIVNKDDIVKILIAIALGAVAGTVGWIMVKSGLKENTVLVNPVNLMSHILVATLIVVYVLRVGLEYLYPKEIKPYDQTNRNFFSFLMVFVFIQIGLGALVAGSKAALICTTFPLMNGHYFPTEINFANNDVYEFSTKLLFQFLHRNLAYFIFFYVIFIFFKTKNVAAQFQFHRTRWFLLIMVFVQVLLGVLTLVYSKGHIPIVFGVLHQIGAFLLLIFSIEAHYFIKYRAK
ncbi:MAG TPA: COX15/CtaA family protein [Chitinophagales bacterium]|nr:COX15/CtaA family protein [Chitinophagales bacterium]